MAKFQDSRSYLGKTADDCFLAAEPALTRSGFKVWKKRDIAWLVQAKCEENGKTIDANLSARPGAKTTVTLNLSAEGVPESELKPFAEKIFQALETELK